jgi:hypothetical protein
MKTSTKLFTAALLAVAFFTKTASAQMSSMSSTMPANPWRFGIGLETGLPTGNLNKVTMWELGGTARLQYTASKDFGIILTSGYYNFFAGSYSGTTTTIGSTTYGTVAHSQGIIPVKIGFKAYIMSHTYFSAEGGVGFETQYNEDKKLILSPGLGWADNKWDISARYENFSGQGNNYGMVGLRLAYGFGL